MMDTFVTIIHGLFWFAVLVLIYFIPAIMGRDKTPRVGIFLANLFFGWTFIGWVATLIWAVSLKQDPEWKENAVVSKVNTPL